MKTKTKFPETIELTEGSITVSATIYETPTKGRASFTLVYYAADGQRKRETAADYGALRTRADEVLADLKSGRQESVALPVSQREAFCRMLEILTPTGQHFELAASRYAEAFRILGGDLVVEAARDYVKRQAQKIEPKAVAVVVTEFLDTRRKQNRSERHLTTLESHCNRFAKAFVMNIGDVRASDVENFLQKLRVAPRTHDNFLRSIKNLFEFAKSKKYLPKDWDELEAVPLLHNGGDEAIEIYTANELELLLKHANKQLVPFLAIGAFAGLRSSEVERLEWSDVKFDSDCIIVQKGKVKKRGKSRRMAPLLPNLKAILQPLAKSTGKVWPHSHPYLYELLREGADAAGLKLKSNALRHSFISYRVAAIKNVPQVALESGNSPEIIFSNYRELVTEADAKKWFGIVTNPPDNVVQMPSGEAKQDVEKTAVGF